MKENKSIYLDFKGYEVIKLNMNKILFKALKLMQQKNFHMR